ncbi:hypothetical protein G7077_05040 [Sphingomonas piscis]|uniref:Uncharacterized protein n=1 Tax=Sphingomonas piscis TaxID=2714943 RepID=A0A6G7YNQ3_9SPHN|nr:hypothetical protein [Sphingomonas piscis]QIK78364.1 hypothetical protein G7077_05040 [Sphingomonas piscis]
MLLAAIVAAPALAQSTAPADPPPTTVGPRELRNFSLPGTAPAPQNQPQQQTPDASPDSTAPARAPSPSAGRPSEAVSQRPSAPADRNIDAPASQPPADPPQDLSSQPADAGVDPLPQGGFETQPSALPPALPPAATQPVPQNGWGMVPWLVAALAAVLAIGFALYRRRARAALSNAEQLEAFIPAEPAPPPRPMPRAASASPSAAPAIAPAPKSASGGVVSTRLRPVLDLDVTPGRCIIDQTHATLEFTLVALNSGNAPARDVRIEVAMLNAGPAQDQEIAAFFQQPAGVGDPIEGIPPMRSIELNSRVSMPLEQVRAFEVAGRRLLVPLIAFNALFRWTSGEGQTSQSYLVGREGDGEKMAPFRLDLGPRVFRNLGARPHHMQVRR